LWIRFLFHTYLEFCVAHSSFPVLTSTGPFVLFLPTAHFHIALGYTTTYLHTQITVQNYLLEYYHAGHFVHHLHCLFWILHLPGTVYISSFCTDFTVHHTFLPPTFWDLIPFGSDSDTTVPPYTIRSTAIPLDSFYHSVHHVTYLPYLPVYRYVDFDSTIAHCSSNLLLPLRYHDPFRYHHLPLIPLNVTAGPTRAD